MTANQATSNQPERRGHRLPAPGDAATFTGDEAWAGDLVQALQDVDSSLPTDAQKAGLDAAETDAEYAPSANNAFVTQSKLTSQLPGGEARTDWPIGVTQPQRDGLDQAEADSDHAPSTTNPFVTQSKLPTGLTPAEWPLGVTSPQKDALDHAHKPSKANPFATLADLPIPSKCDLTLDESAAVKAAQDPGLYNPFITKSALPPDELTPERKDALDKAYQPSADNPLATMADVALAGITMRAVAAGTLDLGRIGSGPLGSFGGLKVRAFDPNTGLATLHFTCYQPATPGNYVIKALPVRDQTTGACRIVEFVAFNQDGFMLRMCQARDEKPSLGLCMVEVSEMTGDPHPLVQAIYNYFSLIQENDYASAWQMMSPEFRQAKGLTDISGYINSWTKSGAAIVRGMMVEQVANDTAMVILDLRFDKAIEGRKNVRIRYGFRRSESEGALEFARWLFVSGENLAEH